MRRRNGPGSGPAFRLGRRTGAPAHHPRTKRDARARAGRHQARSAGLGEGQPPLPAEAVSALWIASAKAGGQGPCPATTYGDVCTISKLAGSVVHLLAHVSTSASRRSHVSWFLKM